MSRTRIIVTTANAGLFRRLKDWYLTKYCQDKLWKDWKKMYLEVYK